MEISSITKPQLRQGSKVPLFVLPAAAGGTSGPGALRSKYNMVLALVGAGRPAEDYLRMLSAANRDILEQQARIICVVTVGLLETADLASSLALPFTLLADGDAGVTRRMLGGASMAGLCVADRFGEVYFLEVAGDAVSLPPPEVALDWLLYIQVQCPE
jgi:hypothetical protein